MNTTRTADSLPLDTSPDADAVQLDVYRRLGGAGRLAIVFRLNALVRQAAAAGIRRRHPDYKDDQVRAALMRLRLGDDLMRRVFPERDLVDP
jgi:hypothetical protein